MRGCKLPIAIAAATLNWFGEYMIPPVLVSWFYNGPLAVAYTIREGFGCTVLWASTLAKWEGCEGPRAIASANLDWFGTCNVPAFSFFFQQSSNIFHVQLYNASSVSLSSHENITLNLRIILLLHWCGPEDNQILEACCTRSIHFFFMLLLGEAVVDEL